MSEIIKSIFGIAEKFLSLWQLWSVLLIVTGFISHAPESLQTLAKINYLPTLATNISSILFLFSSVVLLVKLSTSAWKSAKQEITERRYKFSDLSDEELAVIYFYADLIEPTAEFDEKRPAIKNLRRKGMIGMSCELGIMDCNPALDFALTKSGHKFLKKHQAKLADLFSDKKKFLVIVSNATGKTFSEEIPQKY